MFQCGKSKSHGCFPRADYVNFGIANFVVPDCTPDSFHDFYPRLFCSSYSSALNMIEDLYSNMPICILMGVLYVHVIKKMLYDKEFKIMQLQFVFNTNLFLKLKVVIMITFGYIDRNGVFRIR